jgi:nucleotide-binding universal stress UspA family protein
MTTVVGFSPNAEGRAALAAAADEALLRGTDLLVVGPHRDEPLDTEALAAELGPRHADLVARGIKVDIAHSDLRDPGDAVVQVAQRAEASLIVIGVRHRTPVGKLILGSIAQRILLEATCPVLAVKPPAH